MKGMGCCFSFQSTTLGGMCVIKSYYRFSMGFPFSRLPLLFLFCYLEDISERMRHRIQLFLLSQAVCSSFAIWVLYHFLLTSLLLRLLHAPSMFAISSSLDSASGRWDGLVMSFRRFPAGSNGMVRLRTSLQRRT